MICKWSIGNHTFEFDAENKAEKTKKVRAICRERGWRGKDMVKEKQNDKKRVDKKS